MTLKTIYDHTVDVDRLRGGWVLDAGCRDFSFARAMAARGCRVLALDADASVIDQKIAGVQFHHLALANEDGSREFALHDNLEARGFVHHNTPASVPRTSVEAVSLKTLMERYGVERWDCVKLDIEGAEYAVLRDWPGPIASQISVEFHEHCVGRQAPDVYDRVFARLSAWYEIAQHQRSERYCAGSNYWDSLLVQR